MQLNRLSFRGLAALFVAAVVVGSGTAVAGTLAQTTDKGIVQSVSATSIVLRGLDGADVPLALGPGTRVRLNGREATLEQLRPGLVAAVTHNGDKPARIVRAFGAVKVVEQGTVVSVSKLVLTVRRQDETLVTIGMAPDTVVRRFGRPARRAAIKPGRLVRVTYVPGSPAQLVAVVRRLR